jgi:hypothetical protein
MRRRCREPDLGSKLFIRQARLKQELGEYLVIDAIHAG